MQFTTILAMALPALALAAPAPIDVEARATVAPTASIVNNCTFTVYVQSVTDSTGHKGPVHTLAHGGNYSEAYQPGGANIRMGTGPGLSAPLSTGYNATATLLYYDLSDQFGNPFLAYRNILKPSITTCHTVNCAPNAETCYSDGNHIHENTCSPKSSLVLTLCAL